MPTGLGISLLREALTQEQVALEALPFWGPIHIFVVRGHDQRLFQQGQRVVTLAGLPTGVGQQGKKIRLVHCCPSGVPGRWALPHLGDPLCLLSRLG